MPNPDEILPRTAWTDYSGGTMDHTWSDALTSDTRYRNWKVLLIFPYWHLEPRKLMLQKAAEKTNEAGI